MTPDSRPTANHFQPARAPIGTRTVIFGSSRSLMARYAVRDVVLPGDVLECALRAAFKQPREERA